MRTKASCLLAGLCMALAAHAHAAGGAAPVEREDATNDLSVVVGRTVLLDCAQPVERVAIGLGGFAEATPISPTEIMVNGKTAGETSLILWEKGGNREFFNVTVRPSNYGAVDQLADIRRELRMQLPGQAIKISTANGTIFLSGTAKDLTSSNRAEQIAGVAGKVVNLLNVDVPKSKPQILLKVVFASIDRNRSRQLGLNLFSTGFGNVLGAAGTNQFSPPLVAPGTSVTGSPVALTNDLNLFAFLPGLNIGGTLQALEEKGVAEVLAQPNVLAEDGKQGSFLAGGEYPYPIAQATGGGTAISIMFKDFGVRLNFIPTITPRNTIQLQVAPEVSSLDFANGVTISGFSVPAVDVRRVKTEVELQEGQSFAIGGLLDNRETDTFEKIPFIGSVPILGKFFQSMSRNKTNTELIVIVTPEIVNPIPAGQPLPALNYPEPFIAPNSKIPMHTPEGLAAVPTKPQPPMPIEKLKESLKPEKPLEIDSSMGPGGGGSGGGGASTGGSPQ
ncbi:MAG: type II and III secretion system protein family protein [Acidobacteriota bacterium]